MDWLQIVMIVAVILAVILAVLYFLNKWVMKRTTQQQDTLERTKQKVSIYVVDKKRDKPENVNLPKAVMDNFPKMLKLTKSNFVKVKIGPQFLTLMCDKRVFEYLEAKKTYKIELAGIYIASVVGMKSASELKELEREKKEQQKKSKLEAKAAAGIVKKSVRKAGKDK